MSIAGTIKICAKCSRVGHAEQECNVEWKKVGKVVVNLGKNKVVQQPVTQAYSRGQVMGGSGHGKGPTQEMTGMRQ